jgi:hypothetical protein
MLDEPFDLDAARAARLEARGEPRLFLFGGQKFELPPELPAEFAYLLDDAKEALRFLLDGQFDDFWAQRPSAQDLIDLVAWITKTYRAALGESTASGSSSTPGGGPSRPTSPATTRSTSAKRSSARNRSGPAGSSR